MMPAAGKICSFDCIYCENGFNCQRRCAEGHNDAATVAAGLEARLRAMRDEGQLPDVITFAGNGEPTAAPEFPQAIAAARRAGALRQDRGAVQRHLRRQARRA